MPTPFPADLVDNGPDPSHSPNIYVSGPSMSLQHPSFPTPLSSAPSLAPSLHSLSPASSPTTTDFHGHHLQHQYPSLTRQPSFTGPGGYDDFSGAKRQRTQPPPPAGKRARSDSAPLGYGFGQGNWAATRPRSGSGLARRDEMVTSIAGGSMPRSGQQLGLPPPPSLPTLPKPSP